MTRLLPKGTRLKAYQQPPPGWTPEEMVPPEVPVPTPTRTPAEALAAAQRERNNMFSHDDIPGSWTVRQREADALRRRVLDWQIQSITDAERRLSTTRDAIATHEAWGTHLAEWRTTLTDELLRLPVAHTEAAFRHQHAITASLAALDHGPQRGVPIETLRLGALLRAAGYSEDTDGNWPWLGPTDEVAAHLADLRQQLRQINGELAVLCLDDAQRTTYEAARDARAALITTLPIRKLTSAGLFDRYPDGRVVWLNLDTETPETAMAFAPEDVGR